MSMFNGTWRIDLAQSKKWDREAGAYLPDLVGEEIITMKIANGIQEYEVLYGDDPVIRIGYTTRYDVADWVPYAVREIAIKTPRSQEEAVAEFRARVGANEGSNVRNFEVGKPYGLIRLVYVDERTHYRIAKAESGAPQNAMLRRMAEDGQSYVASLMDVAGVVYRIRKFVRVS